MRSISLFFLALFAPALAAQEKKEEKAAPISPAVEIRVKAVSDLYGEIEYIAGLLADKESGKVAVDFVKGLAEGKTGLFGVAADKPFGAYVGITEDVANSPVVLMIPVADQESFIELLKGQLKVEPKKLEGGLYSFPIPQLPVGNVYFRFADDYAYFTIRTEKGIEPAKLLKPKDFFAGKMTDVMQVKVNVQKFPADVRKAILGQLELMWNQSIENLGDEFEKMVRKFLVDTGADMVKAFLTDGENLDLALKINPKTDDINLQLKVGAKSGTPLAKMLKSWGKRESAAASMFAEAGPTTFSTTGLNVTLPPEFSKNLGKLIDAVVKERLDNLDDFARGEVKPLVDALLPTLKNGDIQLGLRIDTEAKEKKPQVHLAIKMTDGDKLEEIFKKLIGMYAADVASFDEEKADGFRYHKISLGNDLKDKLGSEHYWLATSDTLWAFGPEKDGLKKALKAKPKAVPFVHQELHLTKIPDTDERDEGPKRMREEGVGVFGKKAAITADEAILRATGGADFQLELSLKGKLLTLFRAIDAAAKK